MKAQLFILLILLGFSSAFSLDSLHFTFPTADVKLVAGSDTLITWDGIAPTDSVSVEYSLDGGNTWLMLSKNVHGLQYTWKNIPKKVGDGYLLRLIYKGEIDKLNEPYIEWQKTYGGSVHDELNDIQELSDGGYIAVGWSGSNDYDLPLTKGKGDIWLLKIDSNGNKIFSKTFGGSEFDYPQFVKQTKDSGFIIGGFTHSKDYDFEGKTMNYDQFIMKLDNDGNIEWVKVYNDSTVLSSGFKDIQETYDGGYILVGDTSYIHPCDQNHDDDYFNDHILILKIDKYGNYEWSKHFGGNLGDEAECIEKTQDGGYIITGWTGSNCGDVTNNNGGLDIWVLKLDRYGNLEWQHTYGGSSSEFSYSIKESENGDFFVLGDTYSNDYDITDLNGLDDILVLKLNNKGEIIWSKTYGGSNQDVAAYSHINPTSDGGFVFSGITASSNGDINEFKGSSDGWFVKLDDDGNIKYQRTFGGSHLDEFFSTQQTKDHGYIIAGRTYSKDGDVTENKGGYDGWIIKLGVNYPNIDTVITTFSIVAPQPTSRDVDMGKVFVGEWRDSTVADFVYNTGSYKFRVDSIYIRGVDKTAFSLIGGFPKYNIEPTQGKEAKFRFTPTRIGIQNAQIVIITQSKTLIQNIIGEGIKKRAKIQATAEPFDNLICENSTNSNVEIKSMGGETLIIKEINLTGPDKSDFSITEVSPINLAPDSSKTISIGFKTNVPGVKTAALEIKSNAEPDSVITIPLSVRKDSVALVPDVTTIDLGTLFPNQTKDTSFVITNLGTLQTDGKVTFTSNINCLNQNFTIDSGGVHQLSFTFTGIPADGNINEKITVWDEICKYSREVLITGKVVSPNFQGFSAIQCKSYSNEYKLTLNNNTSNRLKITSIVFEKNPSLFEIDPSLVFPITIEPFTADYEVKVSYNDDAAQKFSTAVNCFTDNKYIPVITDTVFVETVEYLRTTDALINDTIHNASNPFAVSYDTASLNGKNKFTYSIKVNESANDMDYLTQLSDLEVIINYNANVIGADFDIQTGNAKVRLGEELQSTYSIKSAKETKIDEFNSQILVNIENIGKPFITKEAYKLLEIDFSAYLSNYGLSDEQNSEKSRSAIISHLINSTDECIEYKTANNAALSIEKLCADNLRSIKMPNDTSAKFYLGAVIPHPIGSKGATIEYGLGFECQVTMTIYDVAGSVILVPINEIQKPGTHTQSISSKSLSAGAYFIEMKAGPFKETKRVIVE